MLGYVHPATYPITLLHYKIESYAQRNRYSEDKYIITQ
jgi:hypothetical protein